MSIFHASDAVFLSAYAALAVLLSLGYRHWLTWPRRPRAEQAAPLDAPYALAYLRGGAAEVVRTAVFALLYRGLLTHVVGKTLQRAAHADARNLPGIEREVLARFDTPRTVDAVVWDAAALVPIHDAFDAPLREAGLLNRYGQTERLVHRAAMWVLFGIAAARVVVAIQTHAGYFPLAIAAALIAWFFFAPARHRLTPAGKRALEAAQQAHRPATRQAAGIDDVTWAAAAFGMSAFSIAAYPMAVHVMPPNRAHSTTGDGGGGGYGVPASDGDRCGGSDSSDGNCSDGGGDSGGGGGDGGGGSSD